MDLRRTTTVAGGGLSINSTETDFQDENGSTAITVNGGSPGGTGTINGLSATLSISGNNLVLDVVARP